MTPHAEPLRGALSARRRTDERGIVLVWSALMMVLLIGSAALAIDVSMWHLEKTREQKGADAAALAGAISYPDDPTSADAAALDVAKHNGYPVSAISSFGANDSCDLGVNATIRICSGPGDRSDQYKVTVVRKVDSILGGILGINTTTVKATATGEYLRPLVMGSPSNQYGNDPEVSQTLYTYPNFWGNIAGGNSTKTNGDAYAANDCNSTTDGCSTTGFGNNLNFNPQGYFYSVTATGSGPVSLQAFDPAFVHVGDSCTDGATNLTGASNLANVPSYPQGPDNTTDIHRRYLPVVDADDQDDPGLRYCTGDQLFGSGPPPVTTYKVLKASVPGDPSSATQVCAPTVYPGFNGDLNDALGTGTTVPRAPGPLATYFRQWVTLCTVDAQVGDNFFIQMTTDSQSAGHNRFALRGVEPNSNTPAPVNVAGNAYMGIYANVGARLTQFYLARVPSAAAGHTLVLNFFDIGDASSEGTLQVSPPSDSNVGTSFTDCQWTGSQGLALNTPNAPWGTFGDLSNCTITGVNNGATTWNGQWITVTIAMPADYSCADGDPNGCWATINYNFAGAVNDTTSWNAFLIGDPVRLVK